MSENKEKSLKTIGLLLETNGINVQPLDDTVDGIETIQVARENLLEACSLLKQNKDSAFDLLVSLSAVDKLKEGLFESVYHLYSSEHNHSVVLKVFVSRDDCVVPSVMHIWDTADWHEREAYDLMGIIYEGHSNLQRILMPDDWIGHPLRKDYELTDERLIWNQR